MTDFTTTLPTKRMAACALLLNEQHEWLIVKPTYRPDWLVPGGSIDVDESALAVCKREVKEEIGLDLSVCQLLCFKYQPPHGTKTESIQFVFGVTFSTKLKSLRYNCH